MGISIPQLLILLVIVLLLFGTRRLRNLGSDLGGAIKGFRTAMNDSEQKDANESIEHSEDQSEHSAQQDVDNSTEHLNK
ncbi:MAG TPA: twin-arginine translocase TatA/TatE family subunit [Crenotrichaceae bacterium]|nr:twin-arginine translocase TatA/TatE family subunit [Crenotrichaceae bacterium]